MEQEFKLCPYHVMGYDGTEKVYIGESDRSKRVCRFCGRKSPEVTFKKRAHALSESIGNKFIIGNEECDSCNDFFSAIEQDFFNRHAFPLSCLGVKGKHGIRKIKTPEMSVFTTNNGVLTFAPTNSNKSSVTYDANGVGRMDFSFLLKGYSHRPQSIYKCLVKYALSVIDEKFLSSFIDTIAWIRNEHLNINTLPDVIFYKTNYVSHPRVAYFIRTVGHKKFPFSFSLLEFADMGYFFIIPLGNNEPISGFMLQNFANAFKQLFGNDTPCVPINLSSTKSTISKAKFSIDNIIKDVTAFELPFSADNYS